MGCGGKLKHVLMPEEYRSVMLVDVPPELVKDQVWLYCSSVGTVADVIQFTGKIATKKWGKVTFNKPDTAKKVVEDANLLPFRARPDTAFKIMRKPCFWTKVEWCRRPLKGRGYAFITFQDPEDAIFIKRHNLQIEGTTAMARPSKNSDDEVFIDLREQKGLELNVTREKLEDAVKAVFDDNIIPVITKVSIPREAIGETRQEELNELQMQLSKVIQRYCPTDDFNIQLQTPKQFNATFRASVSFSDPEKGVEVVRCMNRQDRIRNQLINMTPDIRTTIMIRKEVYAVIDDELAKVGDEVKLKHVTVAIHVLDDGGCCVRVNSYNMTDAAYAVGKLQNIARGMSLDIPSERILKQIVSPSMKPKLMSIEKKTKTLIETDRRQSLITLYGGKNACAACKKEIEELFEELGRQSVKEIILKGEGIPVGLVKAIYVRFGIQLRELQTKTGVGHVEINLRSHVLFAWGTDKALDQMQQEITQIQQDLLQQDPSMGDGEGIGDCPVCLCPVVVSDCFILDCCGHPYCKDCIASLINAAVQGKAFPIKCATDDCEQLLFIQDLTNVLKLDDMKWVELQAASLDAYMGQNPTRLRYCVTPNCPVVYRPTREGSLFTCDVCMVNICTRCHVQYHTGIDCDMFQGMKVDEDYSLKKWLGKDPRNRAACPKCKAYIEKNGGCSLVTCTQCRTCICWWCKGTFRTADEVYAHQPHCPRQRLSPTWD